MYSNWTISKIKNEFKSAIEDGIPALTICGGYQFLGEYYKTVDGDKIAWFKYTWFLHRINKRCNLD